MAFLKKYKYELLLALTLIIAALLRFYKLDYRSLWYDELYTMNEAKPSISWTQLLYYCQTDQHPPLFFIIERLFFTLFGYSSWTARSLSAISGVACVLGVFMLGKGLFGKRVGLLAAVIMCVNHYNIEYSQEARPYTFALALTFFSYHFFLRTARYLQKADVIWYVVFTSLMLYTNYFTFLVLLSQCIIALIIWLREKQVKQTFLKTFLVAGLAILVCYAPMV